MSDLISRQAAIDAIDMYNVHGWVEEYFEDLEKELLDLPSYNQWIPCSERLPELPGPYLVTGKMKYSYDSKKWFYFTDVAESYDSYIDDFWCTFNDWDVGQEIHIIAWMPLPDPWKGEE